MSTKPEGHTPGGMLPQSRLGVKGFVEVPISERIKANTVITPTCHLWTGRGYGNVWYKHKRHRVHRLLWEFAHGAIPDGLYVCHSCDVRNCINLDHLWLGTHQENMHDSVVKGRAVHGVGRRFTQQPHCKNGHPYTPENTRVHKQQRRCLTCLRASWKRRNDKRSAVLAKARP